MTRVRRSASARSVRREQGFTLIELLIVVALIGVIASIAIPSLIAARAAANEASAIGSSRTASSGQNAYAGTCGAGFYATSALQLCPFAPTMSEASAMTTMPSPVRFMVPAAAEGMAAARGFETLSSCQVVST